MGLNMYLYKVKKPQPEINVTAKDIQNIDNYLDYITDDLAQDYTLEEWNGGEAVDSNLIALYKPQHQETYASYDTMKLHPYKSILIMIKDWRKANAVHKWFVDKTQNGYDECEPSFVNKEQFEELLSKCQTILKHKDDPNQLQLIAEKELPTQKGFFFGTYNYDDQYIYELQETVKTITEILEHNDFDKHHYIYQAFW